MRSLAYWLTLAFVFTVPWEAAVQIAAIGQLSKVLGLAAAAVWIVSVVARGRLRQPDAFQKAFFLFLIWNGLTFFWSIDSGATMSGFLTYTQVFGMLLVLWDLLDTAPAIEAVLQAYVLGSYVTSAAIVVDFLTAPDTKFPEHRFLALGFEVDAIALTVATAAPAAWYLAAGPALRPRSPAIRLLNYAYIPLGVFALALTGTRGATLASIPTALLVLWSLRRARHARIVALVALAITAVVVIEFAPREPLERIATVSTTTEVASEGALSGRWAIWGESRKAFLDRPIVGAGLAAHRAVVDTGAAVGTGEVKKRSDSLQYLAQGLDARRVAIATGREAHNAYISVLVETGIVGFLFFTGVILTVVARVRQLAGWQAWYWSTQLAVLAIGGMSLSIEARKSVWIFLALAVGSAAALEGSRPPVDVPRTTLTPTRAWD